MIITLIQENKDLSGSITGDEDGSDRAMLKQIALLGEPGPGQMRAFVDQALEMLKAAGYDLISEQRNGQKSRIYTFRRPAQ